MKRKITSSPLILPLPAVLVGSYSNTRIPDAMAAAWASPCSKAPPCLGVAVRNSRQTYKNIMQHKAFTINIPDARHTKEVDYLGIVSAKTTPDKLQLSGLHVTDGEEVDAPLIDECPINIECRLKDLLEIGTHTWIVGEIVLTHANEECITPEGTIDDTAFTPLGYMGASKNYITKYTLGDRAFNIGKQLKKD